MRVCLYSFILFLYRVLVRLLALFQSKAALMNEGQKQVWIGLERQFNENDKPVAWFHSASLGEFEQGRPIIEAYKNENPQHFVLVTFFSPSGYEVRKSYVGADFVSYLPLDGYFNSERFLNLVKPSLAVFIKYEFWYYYLTGLKRRGISTILVSAIFRPNQVFFQWYGGFYRRLLDCFTHLFVQDQSSAELLNRVNVTVAGDTRFDRVLDTLRNLVSWDLLTQFLDNTEFMVVGSAWQADMDVLIPLINSKKYPFKWVIAPHEINAEELLEWEKKIDLSVSYSKGPIRENAEVLFVNEVGRLANLYRGASFAYIGGAFGDGLHSTLEAAVFGPTVFFGNKNYLKFREARELIELGLAFPVGNTEELDKAMRVIYDDDQSFVNKQVKSRAFVQLQAGATDRIIEFVRNLASNGRR
ncbi:MAG: Lipid 3-deoxy-D-manno-octulosonic acid transferase [Bacteroidota bacterium]|jgi:3-deoxy-D-manno-octulosonic-acid transferase